MEAERERRLSRRISGIVVAAAKAVSKLTEGKAEYVVLCLIISHLLVLIFQGSSQEQWTHVRKFDLDFADATLTLFYTADAYFMTLVVFGTYLLINVFIAGISGVFLRMLLKKSRQPNQVTFYNATVMANVLKDDIIKDDERNKRWHIRFINRSKKMHRDVIRAVSRTRSSVKAAFQATSFRFSRQFSMAGGSRRFSRTYSRALSRSVTMGMRAAMDLSHKSRAIVENPNFNRGVLLAVTINIIILCLYKYGMSNDLLYTLCTSDGFCFWNFFLTSLTW
ncbi:hypothetical protein SELMODRAFT_430206 [Selaginella moellendorffii]|uniref:Uncharacterized protein n=1 Tax=Selaginella moellendorffii TaxID=88036 RepID=D8T8P4_SELML|nr:hypothetical protein SELMODRAFT_430206 [Selaginella moellendorffii]